jgi:hypothetical protein
MKEIEEAELRQYLGLYPTQYQLIKNAYYSQGHLKAELIPFIYPFTIEDLDYITATQIHLYLSQLAYVLMAKSITDPDYSIISKVVKYDTYMDKMFAGRLFFANLNQKMKKVIFKKNKSITAEMKILSAKRVKGAGFCEVEFVLGERACYGNILLSIQL